MKKLAIALLLFTCYASPVSAGCAWVLWASGLSGGIALDIYPSDGFKDRETCQKTLVAVREHNKRRENTVMTFTCLPDTIDPRAPKSGK